MTGVPRIALLSLFLAAVFTDCLWPTPLPWCTIGFLCALVVWYAVTLFVTLRRES